MSSLLSTTKVGELLLNGQPFSAIFNLILIVFCLIFGWIFPVLFLVVLFQLWYIRRGESGVTKRGA